MFSRIHTQIKKIFESFLQINVSLKYIGTFHLKKKVIITSMYVGILYNSHTDKKFNLRNNK